VEREKNKALYNSQFEDLDEHTMPDNRDPPSLLASSSSTTIIEDGLRAELVVVQEKLSDMEVERDEAKAELANYLATYREAEIVSKSPMVDELDEAIEAIQREAELLNAGLMSPEAPVSAHVDEKQHKTSGMGVDTETSSQRMAIVEGSAVPHFFSAAWGVLKRELIAVDEAITYEFFGEEEENVEDEEAEDIHGCVTMTDNQNDDNQNDDDDDDDDDDELLLHCVEEGNQLFLNTTMEGSITPVSKSLSQHRMDTPVNEPWLSETPVEVA